MTGSFDNGTVWDLSHNDTEGSPTTLGQTHTHLYIKKYENHEKQGNQGKDCQSTLPHYSGLHKQDHLIPQTYYITREGQLRSTPQIELPSPMELSLVISWVDNSLCLKIFLHLSMTCFTPLLCTAGDCGSSPSSIVQGLSQGDCGGSVLVGENVPGFTADTVGFLSPVIATLPWRFLEWCTVISMNGKWRVEREKKGWERRKWIRSKIGETDANSYTWKLCVCACTCVCVCVHVCVCVCTYMCVCVHVHVCVCVCVCVWMYMCVCVCTYMCVCVHVHVCVCVCVCTCVCVCVCVWMYMCVCVCVCTYTCA